MSVKVIDAKTAHDWLSSGEAILIDVREADEFSAEHIACAASVPLSRIPELFDQMHVPKGRKIIFQCLMGGRGSRACAALPADKNKIYDVYNIDGGIIAWKDAGLPVVVSSDPVLSIVRQVQMAVGGAVAVLVLFGFLGLTLGFVLAGILGTALFVAGLTGWCGLAMLLRRMPWNRT
ncbi:rhodanese-like domain-containing protein [Micavibrio aeruginosavorus]|uniref:Rhodanese-like protein n=1 Tax=Micavibrio aeruginosavorus EPB TaxID=349215 RepID=M4VLB4_9BACT|nr:rhodanese-like domain-containing protein [Micavibrio aeruginosavorus]AGH98906.1 Rhodanese-like protein [Micavibrio aeruginosavorus EPB]